jgi:hypothetical protein
LNRGYHPLGIVAGTFELDSNFWYDRNVVGRLLAVTMGASDLEVDNGHELYEEYLKVCRHVGFQDELCRMYGKNIVPWGTYKREWKDVVWKEWKDRICDRLTVGTSSREFRPSGEGFDMKPSSIWDYFGKHFDGSLMNVSKATRFSKIPQSGPLTPLRRPLVTHTGIIWDLALDANTDPSTTSAVRTIIDEVNGLGFNLIQLRLPDDTTFAYQSKVQSTSKKSPLKRRHTPPIIEAAIGLIGGCALASRGLRQVWQRVVSSGLQYCSQS